MCLSFGAVYSPVQSKTTVSKILVKETKEQQVILVTEGLTPPVKIIGLKPISALQTSSEQSESHR